MKHYKAIIYDIDGTILDTLEMNMYPLIRIIKEELNEDWTYEQALTMSSHPGLRTMALLGIRDIETTYARWVRYVNEYEKKPEMYAGLEAVLDAFQSAGILQAIVSSKMKKQYAIDIVSRGLDRYFSAVVLMEDTQLHKPHPEPIRECLRRLNLQREDVLYVGDALSDYEAARNAGVDFGYAKWGSVFDLKDVRPDYVFQHPADLLALLHRK